MNYCLINDAWDNHVIEELNDFDNNNKIVEHFDKKNKCICDCPKCRKLIMNIVIEEFKQTIINYNDYVIMFLIILFIILFIDLIRK